MTDAERFAADLADWIGETFGIGAVLEGTLLGRANQRFLEGLVSCLKDGTRPEGQEWRRRLTAVMDSGVEEGISLSASPLNEPVFWPDREHPVIIQGQRAPRHGLGPNDSQRARPITESDLMDEEVFDGQGA